TLYLTLATAAAPWFCCCTLGHFHVLLSPKTQPPLGPPACCGHGQALSADPAAVDERAPGEPFPVAPRGPCPCKEGLRSLSILAGLGRPAGVESGGPIAGLYPVEAGNLVIACSLDPRDRGLASGEPISFPFHGPRDILCALRILRC